MKAVVIGNLSRYRGALEALKVRVSGSDDGIAGIRMVMAIKPDFLVLKLELPHLNGINLAKILDLLEISMPIVFVSESSRYRERVLEFRQAVAYFTEEEFASGCTDDLLERIAEHRAGHRNARRAQTANGKEAQRGGHGITLDDHDWVNMLSIRGRKRILIVEDSEMILRFILSVLEKPEDYEIYTAQNGLEGLHKAAILDPDLILTDIQMPQLDGLSMAQILYILGKPCPLVFITAHDDDELLTRARKLDGVLGYMLKSRLKDIAAFTKEVQAFLQTAEVLRETSEKSYRQGSLETLLQTGLDQGVLREELQEENTVRGAWS